MTAAEIVAFIVIGAGLLFTGFYAGWESRRLRGETQCMHRTHAESRRLLDVLREQTHKDQR